MERNDAASFFQSLRGLAGVMWDGEEASPGRRGLDPDSFAETDDPPVSLTFALYSHDERLNRLFVSALRGQPLLPPTGERIRREGLFTLVELGSSVGEPTAAEDGLHSSPLEDQIGTQAWAAPAEERMDWWSPAGYDADFDPMAEEAAAGLYLCWEEEGWQSQDAHAFARLRTVHRPMTVVLCGPGDAVGSDSSDDRVYRQTGVRPLHISLPAEAAYDAADQLAQGLDEVVAWMAASSRGAPICLGQELPRFRARLGRQQVQRAAVLATMLGAEPAPLIDIPLLLLVQQRVARQLAAIYGRPAPPLVSREGAGIITFGLCTRHVAQQAMKLIPFVGWLLCAGLSGLSTWLLGQAILRHYEGGTMAEIALLKALGEGVWNRLRRRKIRRRRAEPQPQAIPLLPSPPAPAVAPHQGEEECLPFAGRSAN